MAPHLRLAIGFCLLLAAAGPPSRAAENPDDGDIRDIRLGMRADALPAGGYTGFACAAVPAQALAGWSGFRRCPPDAAGLREVGFRFDQSGNPFAAVNDRFEGTKVAGHPVLLSLLLDTDGIVTAIRIVTDPRARLYYRKKAFLLGLRVKQRYGAEGWHCVDRPRAPGETAVGGMFIKQRCEKTDGARRLVLETSLYRKPGQAGREFEDATRLEIVRAPS